MTLNITERKNTRSPKHEGGGGGRRERDKKGPKAQLLIKVPLGSPDTGSFSSLKKGKLLFFVVSLMLLTFKVHLTTIHQNYIRLQSFSLQFDVIFFLGVNLLEEGDRD